MKSWKRKSIVSVVSLACVSAFVGWVASGAFGSSPQPSPAVVAIGRMVGSIDPSQSPTAPQDSPPYALSMNIDLGNANAAECTSFQNVYNAFIGPLLDTPASQWSGIESSFYNQVGQGFHYLELTVSGYTDPASLAVYTDSVTMAQNPTDSTVEHRFTSDLIPFESFCGGTTS